MKSPPVTRLVLKRFRSFPTTTLVFDNPLFVVGRNGSGKSNLADAFSFVSEAMSSPLQAVFDRRGGIAAVRNRSSVKSAPPNLGLAFELGPLKGITGGRCVATIRVFQPLDSSFLLPKAVRARCEWGHDDYSLKVENLPKARAKPGQQELF